MTETKQRGRPEYQATDEDREKVKVLKAAGMSNVAIATALNISEPTLRKHFSLELDVATAKVRAEVLMATYRSAMGGNVQAQRRMLEHLDALPQRPEKSKSPPKVGKKEMIQRQAEEATREGEWGALLEPDQPQVLQ